MEVEVQHLFSDSFGFGLWSGLLGMPPWLAFCFWVGGLFNPAAFRGWEGLMLGAITTFAGSLIGIGIVGLPWMPDSSPLLTGLCMGTLMYFLLSVAIGFHNRSTSLHKAREKLRDSERGLARQLHEIRDLQNRLQQQSLRDPLTNLLSRPALMEVLERDLSRAAREKTGLALYVVNLDHFRAVNERYGYETGDRVLQALGEFLRQYMRASDVVGRLGGEDFAVILGETSATNAVIRADALRAAWAGQCVRHGGNTVNTTLSIGIAVYPDVQGGAQRLVDAACVAIRGAKERGRNCVELSHVVAAAGV